MSELIGTDIEGKTILDLGSGPNPKLGEYVKSKGGHYVAFDIDENFLNIQAGSGSDSVLGSVKSLPFPNQSIEIAHMRFVLMHQSPADKDWVIAEAVRISSQRAIFMDYDWTNAGGNPVVDKFVELQKGLAHTKGIDIFSGKTLEKK